MASNESTNDNGPRLVSTCPTVSTGEQDLAGSVTGGQPEKDVGICKFFQQGRCHFGNRCHLSHSICPYTAKGVEEGLLGKKTSKKKVPKKSDSSPKNVENEEPSKKPRMRPANEVVSRILWDSSLNPEQFGVGYLDRFLGVLERPFSEFSWDRDVCNCDYSEELAIPQHRIKYFTYNGKKIWDRESRMDGVFGSTGGPLEPPFAAGESGEEASVTYENTMDHLDIDAQDFGETEHDTIEESPDTSSHVLPRSTSDVKPSYLEAAGNKTTLRPQEMQEGSLTNIIEGDDDGLEDTPCKHTEAGLWGAQGGEGEVGMQGDAAVRGPDRDSAFTSRLALADRRGDDFRGGAGEEDEWKESWDGNEEKAHLSWHFPSALPDPIPKCAERVLTQSDPLEQRRKLSRRKPTHFISFPANSPAFITGFQRLQKEVTAILPLSEPYWIPPNSLHVTLCLLVLSEPREVNLACEMLKRFAQSYRAVPLSISCSPELRDFGGRVLYLTPQPLSQIQALNSPLQKLFKEKGWLHRDSLSPNYHLTLAKEKVNEGERNFKGVWEKVKNVENVRTIDLGTLAVDRLYLCAMGAPKAADGSYETLCAVSL
ncbi:leukocyte receptor cluster member 9 [Brienomyrus brachyistius]|uniref:leukocyte receptor cluster member 9 n=1 Tax=Brienomyrus brachyistius TaxID=42636 RepID=UPI0020B33F7F|nr:leukocyte receptor cluster member 9 [Brienomyrus brachyistius]XP_048881670.1 leukocyte receptor cluster member 9 [Brienomyrus brachyistius]